MKKLLLFIVPLLAIVSCSDDDDYNEPIFYLSESSLYFDARNPEPQKVTITADQNITDWHIDHVYDQTNLVDNPEWCKAIVIDDKTIEVTLLSHDSESNSRQDMFFNFLFMEHAVLPRQSTSVNRIFNTHNRS